MFVDVRLPDGDGTDLLNCPAAGGLDRRHDWLRDVIGGELLAGAFDYIIKPFSASNDVILRKADNLKAVRSANPGPESIDAAPLIGVVCRSSSSVR